MAERQSRPIPCSDFYSKRFEKFVDEELNGDNSDMDLTDDDDVDKDPDFVQYDVIEREGRLLDDEEEEDLENGNIADPTAAVRVASAPVAAARPVASAPVATASPVASAPVTVLVKVTRGSPRGAALRKSVPVALRVIHPVDPPVDPSKERLFWKKQDCFEPLPPAPEHEEQPLNAMNLPPHEYVSKYIPDDIFTILTTQTNRRYVEQNGRPLVENVEQMKKFFAACIMISLLGLPRIRLYWSRKTKVEAVASLIPRDKFFAIRNNLKLVYDDDVPQQEKTDSKFWKVNPLTKSIQTGCLLNPRSQTVAVDEQMVPFWGHAPARQVIKSKPNPCGLKIFAVAAPDGLPLDFFFYNGKGDPIVQDQLYSTLDVGGKAVIKLLQTFPPGISVYMDRYFNSEHLLDLLHSEYEATGTGTLKKQRIPRNSKLKEDKVLKKEGRGSVDQSVRSDGQIAVLKWYDNKGVILMSSKDGKLPIDKCKRWCRVQKEYIEVERPIIVANYNQNMGGVDFLDRMISYYRISARTRKWTIRVIMHLVDFAISASWIEYRRDQRALGTPKKEILDLFHFKEEYGEYLAYGGESREAEDSDSDYSCSLPPSRKKPRVSHPPDILRTKNVLHLPELPQPATKNRCRFPGCSSNGARIRCSTCNVFLCIQETRNCFKLYHEL